MMVDTRQKCAYAPSSSAEKGEEEHETIFVVSCRHLPHLLELVTPDVDCFVVAAVVGTRRRDGSPRHTPLYLLYVEPNDRIVL